MMAKCGSTLVPAQGKEPCGIGMGKGQSKFFQWQCHAMVAQTFHVNSPGPGKVWRVGCVNPGELWGNGLVKQPLRLVHQLLVLAPVLSGLTLWFQETPQFVLGDQNTLLAGRVCGLRLQFAHGLAWDFLGFGGCVQTHQCNHNSSVMMITFAGGW